MSSWPADGDAPIGAAPSLPSTSQTHKTTLQAPSQMEVTWRGIIKAPRDAFVVLEATRAGILPPITRRLTDLERSRLIEPGAVFVWSEEQAGIRRWTDNRKWSPSRVSGPFLLYSELLPEHETVHLDSILFKQSFSATTNAGQKLHMIAYYNKYALDSERMPTVASDSRLRDFVVDPDVYPEHRAAAAIQTPTCSAGAAALPARSSSRARTSLSPIGRHQAHMTAPDLGSSSYPGAFYGRERRQSPSSILARRSSDMAMHLPTTRPTPTRPVQLQHALRQPSALLSSENPTVPTHPPGRPRLPPLHAVLAWPTPWEPGSALVSPASSTLARPEDPSDDSSQGVHLSENEAAQLQSTRSQDDQAQLDSFPLNFRS